MNMVEDPYVMGKMNTGEPYAATCIEVRNELRRFAEDYLQPQLARLAERLQQDIHTELQQCQQQRASAVSTPATLQPSNDVVGRPKGIIRSRAMHFVSPRDALYEGGLFSPKSEIRRSSLTTHSTILCRNEQKSSPSLLKQATTEEVKSCMQFARMVVNHLWFDRVVSVAIIFNAIYMGIATEYTARSGTQEKPTFFVVVEQIFLFVFSVEMGLRLLVHRCALFKCTAANGTTNELLYWNIFDCVIILLQVVELIMSTANQDIRSLEGLPAVRVLKLVRLVRVVRLVKVLRFVRELRMIVYSIWRSLKLFFWAITAILLLNFTVSVCFTEVILAQRVQGQFQHEELDNRFGTLTRTMLSLFMAVSGGVDWGDLTDIIAETNIYIMGPFILFVAFNQIAMLNVISGVFLETAMEIARDEKEIYVVRNAKVVFKTMDHNNSGQISWPDFERSLDHPRMRDFFDAVDIRISEAKALFDLLDESGNGLVSSDEFLNGCLRVRGHSKALDLLVLSREVAHLFEKHSLVAGNVVEGGRQPRTSRLVIPHSVDVTSDEVGELSPRPPENADPPIPPDLSDAPPFVESSTLPESPLFVRSGTLPGECR